ncbi:hypothetical protein LCW13_08095 [Cobetia amphilecti]|uniref:hypothetical protein n=1 Tax=Cobetia amphilecti TaxID=1055104 RepID=UPI001CDA7D42|nr:hypothetical protein [Cobetia amphilecti]UBU50192.1 hypothetical protein LCW13_08095 [Cobetia amphilecti]
MKDKIKLNPGETLKLESQRSKGTMAETDISKYAILDSSGEKVGSILYKDHTSIKGFNRTQSIEQRDSHGNIVVEVTW